MPANSALIIPSYPIARRGGDVDWPYRPSSDMLYLTGFEESHSCLLVLSSSQKILFVQKQDKQKALWTGPVYGPDLVSELFPVDSAYPHSEFASLAPSILKNCSSFYYPFGVNPSWDRLMDTVIQALSKKNKCSPSVHDPLKLMAPLRMQKSTQEVNQIQKAIDISAKAFKEVIRHTRPNQNERELYGLFLYEISKQGAVAEAYPGIFASGPNACILHYTHNNRVMKSGELLLVDAGAEYNYYGSDITRTFPVNGRFSKTQKRLYNKLLKIQKKMIAHLAPGMFFSDIQKLLVKEMAYLMKEENLLSGSLAEIIKKASYKQYFPHFFGHSLGLDVHDVVLPINKGLLKSSQAKEERGLQKGQNKQVWADIQLTEGFVLTMEPGLYLPPEDTTLPLEKRGLGFRIEDDILITKTGAKVLSQAIPKEAEEITNLMN